MAEQSKQSVSKSDATSKASRVMMWLLVIFMFLLVVSFVYGAIVMNSS